MPEDFHAVWMQKVEEEAMEKKNRTEKPSRKTVMTRVLSAAAALVFVVGGTLLTRDTLSPSVQTAIPKEAAYDGGDYDSAPDGGYALQRSYMQTAENSSLDTAYAGETVLTAGTAEMSSQ